MKTQTSDFILHIPPRRHKIPQDQVKTWTKAKHEKLLQNISSRFQISPTYNLEPTRRNRSFNFWNLKLIPYTLEPNRFPRVRFFQDLELCSFLVYNVDALALPTPARTGSRGIEINHLEGTFWVGPAPRDRCHHPSRLRGKLRCPSWGPRIWQNLDRPMEIQAKTMVYLSFEKKGLPARKLPINGHVGLAFIPNCTTLKCQSGLGHLTKLRKKCLVFFGKITCCPLSGQLCFSTSYVGSLRFIQFDITRMRTFYLQ